MVPGTRKHVVVQSAGEHVKMVPGAGKPVVASERKRVLRKSRRLLSVVFFVFYEFLEQSYRPTNVKLDCSRPVISKGQVSVFFRCRWREIDASWLPDANCGTSLEASFSLLHHLWHTYLMKNYLNINLPRQVVEDFLCHARRHCFPATPYDKNIKLGIKFTIGRFSLDFHWTLNQTKNTWPWRAINLSPRYGHVVLVSG